MESEDLFDLEQVHLINTGDQIGNRNLGVLVDNGRHNSRSWHRLLHRGFDRLTDGRGLFILDRRPAIVCGAAAAGEQQQAGQDEESKSHSDSRLVLVVSIDNALEVDLLDLHRYPKEHNRWPPIP